MSFLERFIPSSSNENKRAIEAVREIEEIKTALADLEKNRVNIMSFSNDMIPADGERLVEINEKEAKLRARLAELNAKETGHEEKPESIH